MYVGSYVCILWISTEPSTVYQWNDNSYMLKYLYCSTISNAALYMKKYGNTVYYMLVAIIYKLLSVKGICKDAPIIVSNVLAYCMHDHYAALSHNHL